MAYTIAVKDVEVVPYTVNGVVTAYKLEATTAKGQKYRFITAYSTKEDAEKMLAIPKSTLRIGRDFWFKINR